MTEPNMKLEDVLGHFDQAVARFIDKSGRKIMVCSFGPPDIKSETEAHIPCVPIGVVLHDGVIHHATLQVGTQKVDPAPVGLIGEPDEPPVMFRLSSLEVKQGEKVIIEPIKLEMRDRHEVREAISKVLSRIEPHVLGTGCILRAKAPTQCTACGGELTQYNPPLLPQGAADALRCIVCGNVEYIKNGNG